MVLTAALLATLLPLAALTQDPATAVQAESADVPAVKPQPPRRPSSAPT